MFLLFLFPTAFPSVALGPGMTHVSRTASPAGNCAGGGDGRLLIRLGRGVRLGLSVRQVPDFGEGAARVGISQAVVAPGMRCRLAAMFR